MLAGRVLTRCEFRVPALATTNLTGVLLAEVVSRGKHQLFRFANGYTLHSHFRMDGTWRIYPRGRRWSGGAEWQIRALLSTAEHDVAPGDVRQARTHPGGAGMDPAQGPPPRRACLCEDREDLLPEAISSYADEALREITTAKAA